MNHDDMNPHGPSMPLAQSEVGHISVCSCGVVTVTLHYMSLRFEPAAFRELQGMLNHAQRRLDGDPALAPPAAGAALKAPPVH